MLGLTRWSPFGPAFQLHREMDDLFDRFFGQTWRESGQATSPPAAWSPAVESYAKDGQLHVRVALPGIDPKDVEISAAENVLTIRGERKAERQEDDGGHFLREMAYGRFERTLGLPEGVDPAKITARYVNGMLDATLPALLQVAPRKVEIQVEESGAASKSLKAA